MMANTGTSLAPRRQKLKNVLGCLQTHFPVLSTDLKMFNYLLKITHTMHSEFG